MKFGIALFLGLGLFTMLVAFQRDRFRGYRSQMEAPPEISEKTEFAFARLQYGSNRGGWRRRGGWATDYPEAERHFSQGVQRLTRIHTRAIEQIVDIESDEIYDWPWLYAVEVGGWGITEEQGKRLRDYLDRGGFLMVDDFHGTYEWQRFEEGLRQIFPDRPVVEIENDHPIFHVLYSLDKRVQVPGIQYTYSGQTYERDGIEPRWRGIFDDKGRIQVAICFNMDLGDAWEHADWPEYPEPYTSLAYRIGINYLVYSFTH